MKKNILTKLRALVLAIVMVLGTCISAVASEISSEAYNVALGNAANSLYEELMQSTTASELIDKYEQRTDDQVIAFKLTLNDETRANLQNHINSLIDAMTTDDIIEVAVKLGMIREEICSLYIVPYKNVGPLLNTTVEVPTVEPALVARLSSRSVVPNNGLNLSKKTEKVEGTDSYKITLEAYTTGNVSTSVTATPTDVVLVLDESGSMKDSLNSYTATYEVNESSIYYIKIDNQYHYVGYCDGKHLFDHEAGWFTGTRYGLDHFGTRYSPLTSASDTASGTKVQFYTQSSQTKNAALESAALNFVQNVYDDAVENNVDHRVAVVGFSSDNNARIHQALANSSGQDIRNTKTAVDNAIKGLNTDGGTYIEDGLTQAKNAFDTAPTPTTAKRKRVVVIFTDGIPGSGTWNDTTINNSANPAIATAKTLKSTATGGYSATIYTIGLVEGANPAAAIDTGTSNDARTNRFLHYLSSNYPNASSMNNGGTGGSNKGYYLAPQDSNDLNEIFEKISEEIAKPSIELDQTTTIKDIVSPYFVMPANTTDVTVKEVACTGYTDNQPTWSTSSTTLSNAVSFADSDASTTGNDTIQVTGFNFNDNFVSSTARGTNKDFYGKKVVIEFTVKLKAGFLGGNGVPTNGSNSGVYSGNTLVEQFAQPTVDLSVNAPEVKVTDKNVYLLATPTQEQLMDGAVVTIKDTYGNPVPNFNVNAANFGLEAWQYEYVDLEVTKPAAITVPMTTDGEYKLSFSMVAEGEEAKPVEATGKINVFKPVMMFKDSTINYLADAPANPAYYEANNKVTTHTVENNGEEITTTYPYWANGSTLSTEVTMTTEVAPALTTEYSPLSGITDSKVTSQTHVPVNVTVKIDNTDVTEHVTFHHDCDCDLAKILATNKECTWSNEDDSEFWLHVINVYGKMTITKAGLDQYTYPDVANGDEIYSDNESAVITVYGPINVENVTPKTWTIVLQNNHATLANLYPGQYVVTEDMKWSWRYDTVTVKVDKEATETNTANKKVSVTVTVEGGDTPVVVDFINSGYDNDWLGGDNYAVNTFSN